MDRLHSAGHRTALAAALVAGLVFLVHGRTLSAEWAWVYDDYRFILKNPHVHSPSSWTAFFTNMETTDPVSPTGIVRPLRTLEFALDARIFGLDPAAFRLQSLLWFSAGGVLLLLLLRDLLGDLRAAAAGAALWALHPMQTECADWISSRGDVAAGALTVGSVWAAVRSRGTDRWFATSLAAGAGAMLFKESAVVLPGLVALGVSVRREAPVPLFRALRAAWPWFALSAVYLVYRSSVQIGTTSHVTTYVLGGSTAGTFATIARSFGAYLAFAVLPVRPAIDWFLPHSRGFAEDGAWAWALVHLALLGAAVRALLSDESRQDRRALGAAALWFYGALAPVANWPFYLGIPTTERWLHLSLPAVALVVAVAVRAAPRILPAVSVAVAACGVATFLRTGDWKSEITLWGATVADVDSPRAEGVYSAEQRRDGVARWRAAERLPPGTERERTFDEARALFEEALEHSHRAIDLWREIEDVAPEERETQYVAAAPHVNASNCCYFLKRPQESLWHAEEAIRIQEDGSPAAHYTRCLALLELGRGGAAVRAIERSIELGIDCGDDVTVMLERAAVLCEDEGETELAQFALAIASSFPTRAAARSAQLREQLGQRIAARRDDLRRRVEAEPDVQRPRVALALALAGDGEVAEADAVARLGIPDDARLLWLRLRWMARATPGAWREVLHQLAADAPDSAPAEHWFLRGRAAEELREDETARAAFRTFLQRAGAAGLADAPDDPRVAHARGALQRFDLPCPALGRTSRTGRRSR